MKSGIYLITNLINGKVYVGKSKDVHKRLVQHKGDLRHQKHVNPHLQNAWNQYKEENFIFEIIEKVSEHLIHERELHWIRCYDALNRTSGYNMSEPDLTVERLRNKNSNSFIRPPVKEETKKKISNSLKGHEIKPETLQKMSKTWFKKGQKVSEKTIQVNKTRLSKTYRFVSPKGEIVKIINLAQFCRDNKLCVTAMRKIHKGSYYTYDNYRGWKKV